MEFEKVNVILSEDDYEEMLQKCNEKNRIHNMKRKIRRITILLIGIISCIKALVILFLDYGSPFFIFDIGVALLCMIVYFHLCSSDDSELEFPDDNIQLSHMLRNQEYEIIDIIIDKIIDKDIKITLADKEKIVRTFYLSLSSYMYFEKTDIDKPLLNLKDKVVLFPYESNY